MKIKNSKLIIIGFYALMVIVGLGIAFYLSSDSLTKTQKSVPAIEKNNLEKVVTKADKKPDKVTKKENKFVIAGKILDIDTKKPIKAAKIIISGSQEVKLETDSRGAFSSANLIPGKYTLLTEAEGYLPTLEKEIILPSEKAQKLVIMLERAARIYGKITYTNQAPVLNAIITLKDFPDQTKPFKIKAVTDKNGYYNLEPIPTGTEITVIFSLPSEEKIERKLASLEPGQAQKLDLEVKRKGSIKGSVIDMGGKSIPFAEVFLKSKGREVARVKCNEKGNFDLKFIPEGVYQLYADEAEYLLSESIILQLKEGENKENIVIKLESGRTISGQVLDQNGVPVSGAKIEALNMLGFAREAVAFSDETGFYRLTGLSPGEFLLVATHDNYSEKRLKDITSGEDNVEIVMEDCNASLHGVLLDAATQQPLANYQVSVLYGPEKKYNDSNGEFLLSGLCPGSKYLIIKAPGYVPLQRDTAEISPSEYHDLGALSLAPEYELSGHIYNQETGEPVPEASVVLLAPKDMLYLDVKTISDQKGAFTLKGVPSGMHKLHISKPGYTMKIKGQVIVPGSPVDIYIKKR